MDGRHHSMPAGASSKNVESSMSEAESSISRPIRRKSRKKNSKPRRKQTTEEMYDMLQEQTKTMMKLEKTVAQMSEILAKGRDLQQQRPNGTSYDESGSAFPEGYGRTGRTQQDLPGSSLSPSQSGGEGVKAKSDGIGGEKGPSEKDGLHLQNLRLSDQFGSFF